MEANARERLALSAQDRLEDRPNDWARKADVERSQSSRGGEPRELVRSLDPCEDVARLVVEGLARRGEGDAAFRPREQLDSELPLERHDLLA